MEKHQNINGSDMQDMEMHDGAAPRREGLMPDREIRLSPVNTGADYILPDYMGDIRKVLNYSARVVPSGRFVGEGEVSFVGIVCYSIVYLDNENKLTQAEFTSDYEYEVKVGEKFVDGDSRCELAGLSVRPSAPRKLSARATLVPTVIMAEDKTPPSPQWSEGTYTLPSVVRESSIELMRLGEREYAEEGARLQGVMADEVMTVLSGADSIISHADCHGGEVTIEGNINAYALLMIDGETPIRIEKSIPINESFSDACSEDGYIIAEAAVTSLRVTVNDGEANNESESSEPLSSVTFDLTVEFSTRTYGNRETRVALDAFSVSGDCECKYRDYYYNEFIGAVREEIPVSLEVDRSTLEVSGISEILATECRVNQDSCKKSENDVQLEADAWLTVLVKTDDEIGYASHKCQSHILHNIKLPFSCSEEIKLQPVFRVASAETTIDNSKLYIRCKLLCEMLVKEPKKAQIVEEMTTSVSNNEDTKRSMITVYYPEKNDTLWSVAKKYRISPVKIAEENMLDGECVADGGASTLTGVKRIFISRNV